MTTTSKKLIPNKRFPEFEKSGEWVEKKIKDILNYEQPTNYIVKSDNYITHGTPVLTANKAFILGYTNETIGIYNNVPVIIFDDFTTDKKYVSFPFKVKSSAIKILSAKKDYNVKFIYELMTLINLNPQEHKRYYIGTYQNIDVLVPSLKEQQKIADFLSSVDELIEYEKVRLEKLKEYKKGLLQNLFPKENQKVPDLRFPEFKNSGEWEEKKLGDISYYISSNYSVSSALEQGKYYLYDANKLIGFTNEYLCDRDYISIIKDGSGVGRTRYMNAYNNIIGTMGCIVPNNNINSYFLYSLINNINFKQYIKGATIPHIYYSDYSKHIVFMPPLKEQEKIADFLSSLDELIIKKTNKLKLLCDYKKGLLQQLFPN